MKYHLEISVLFVLLAGSAMASPLDRPKTFIHDAPSVANWLYQAKADGHATFSGFVEYYGKEYHSYRISKPGEPVSLCLIEFGEKGATSIPVCSLYGQNNGALPSDLPLSHDMPSKAQIDNTINLFTQTYVTIGEPPQNGKTARGNPEAVSTTHETP